MYVCMYVCVRERERESGRESITFEPFKGSWLEKLPWLSLLLAGVFPRPKASQELMKKEGRESLEQHKKHSKLLIVQGEASSVHQEHVWRVKTQRVKCLNSLADSHPLHAPIVRIRQNLPLLANFHPRLLLSTIFLLCACMCACMKYKICVYIYIYICIYTYVYRFNYIYTNIPASPPSLFPSWTRTVIAWGSR